MNRLTQGVRGRGGFSKSPITGGEMLSFYRKLLELRQFPAEEHRPKLAAYIAGLPGRLARLPRVEAIPKPGVSDYEVNTVVILSGTTSSGPIRVETQFLTHDVEKYHGIDLVIINVP